MRTLGRGVLTVASGFILLVGPALDATPQDPAPDAVEHRSVEQFLTRRDDPRRYCALRFQLDGLDSTGLVKVLLSPRRKEASLLNGAMFLSAGDGELVRVEGRLARSPSFWVQRVDVVRSYQRIEGALLPVAVESVAHVRFFGTSTLRMTSEYSQVDGRDVRN